jgi:phosphate-selective porin OprO and OprP
MNFEQGLFMRTYRTSILLAGAAVIALGASAQAADKKAPPSDPRIPVLEQELRDVQAQLGEIKANQPVDNSAAVADLKRSTSAHYVDINSRLDAQSTASVDNGRLSISSPDGRFTAAVRGLFQFDTGYYSQSHAATALPAAYGNDFGSGSNFRRVYLGLSGKVFGDWSYNLNFDFGGSGGTETPGRIQSVYLQYDGLGPWAFRIGAFPPPASIEDATTPGDTLFLERNSPADLQRNIAGGDGRDAISVIYAAPTVYGAVSVTGDKVNDGAKAYAAAGATAVSNYDEQQAVVGRLAWAPISTPDAHWLIGANGTYVFKTPDLVANGLANATTNPINGATPGVVGNSITLSDPPELTFDSNAFNLATTGALNAQHISQWGVETAGNWGSLYGQAGYFGFNVQRSAIAYATTTGTQIVNPSDDNFSAWYVQAAWLLTGEQRVYNPGTASFSNPKVAEPLNLDKGTWGAFEIAARFSDTNLNDHVNDPSSVQVANAAGAAAGTHTYDFYNTVRGGDQRVATLGLNWFPNNVIKFAFDYEYIQNSKLQSGSSPNALTGVNLATTGTNIVPPTVNGGQNLSAVALRAQLAL